MALETLFFSLDNTLISDEQANQIAFERTIAFLVHQFPNISAKAFEMALREQAETLFETAEAYDFAVQIGINALDGLWGNFNDGSLRFPELARWLPAYRKEVWYRSLTAFDRQDMRLAKILSLMYMAIRTETNLVYPDTYEALDRLSKRYQLVLLTNGAPSLQDLKINKAPKLKNYFKKRIISGDFGQGMPSPEFFEFALKRANATKDTSLMIGANLFTDILGANASGIRSVWINRQQASQNVAVLPDETVDSLSTLRTLLEKED